MNKFEELGLGKGIVEVVGKMGFDSPTEIQEKTIPMILEGHDVIGQSATGSGKTLAFGAPIIEKVRKKKGVQALILTPTRELAEQVANSIKNFGKLYGLEISEIYGGVSIEPQIRKLERAEIVVGTPGRILDHLDRRTLNLSKINWLVLDEADRMADMGFLPDVKKIIESCPVKRQTLLFSATITSDTQYIEKRYMNKPKFVSAKSYVDVSKLKQVFYDVPNNIKFSLLVHLLTKEEKTGLVMVFCNTRRNADLLGRNLRRFKLDSVIIHGRLTQSRRNQVMESFRNNRVGILICTDIAARGLDVQNISHVYNYDIPRNDNEYIHRIGRTARAGKEGIAVNLVSSRDYESFRKIMENDSLDIIEKELPKFENIRADFSADSERPGRGGYSRGGGSGGDGDRRGGGYKDRGHRGENYGGGGRDSRGERAGGRKEFGGGSRDGKNRDSRGVERKSYSGGRGGDRGGGYNGGRRDGERKVFGGGRRDSRGGQRDSRVAGRRSNYRR